MTEDRFDRAWDELSEMVESQQADEARSLIEALPPGEVARSISRMTDSNQHALLELLGPEQSAAVFAVLSDAQTVSIVHDLPPEQAAAIVEELPSAERADLLGGLPNEDASAILEHLPLAEARETRILLQYPPDTAGGLMITEFVSYSHKLTVGDVVEDLHNQGDRYSDYEIQYCYITDDAARLTGVLRLRDLLMAPHGQPVRVLMLKNPLSVFVDSDVSSLKQFFSDHPFVGVPVTDRAGVLVGVVRRAAVEEALGDRATAVFLAVTGLIGEDELRTMPVLHRARRRLSWLSINIVLNVIAASVIAFYQDTLAAVIALAVFLPIISDMSGCSGNQAVAVSIRELTLGLIKPYEFLRVVFKEGAVGLINGVVLGTLLGVVAVLWKGNVYLGLVVGAALMLNTLVAVLLGGLIPLALKSAKQDPALASGPILTTVTDMVGFFLVLSFASGLVSLLA